MKITLLTACLGLSMMLQGQTFRWSDDTPDLATTSNAQIDYTGTAKVYPDYYDGNPTALGEVFYQDQMTAAHKKLALGTIVKVTRLDNGRSTTVRINDRGAYCDGCVIDLSQAAAQQLDIANESQASVRLEIMGSSSTTPAAYATSASLDNEPSLTIRGIAPASTANYASPPPPPNAYKQPQEQLTVRTPFSDKTAVRPTPEPSKTEDAQPKVQPKMTAVSTPEAISVTIIDVPVSPFSVQLGAYGKYSNAERHALRLQQQGFNNIFLLYEPGKESPALHRVIIAPFLTSEAAEEYVKDLAYHHQIKGLVMQTKLVEVE